MIYSLLALMIWLQNPDQWKQQVYEQRYNQAVNIGIFQPTSSPKRNLFIGLPAGRPFSTATESGRVSWYATGLKNPQAFTAACWSDFPKGTHFRVTYASRSVVVVCDDRGHFREMGRMLDLSKGAFESIAPLSVGVITAKVEELK